MSVDPKIAYSGLFQYVQLVMQLYSNDSTVYVLNHFVWLLGKYFC